jgi:hypothetical protein
MKEIYSMDEIRKALSDRVLSIVAQNTGIHKETLYNITNKRQEGISFRVYNILINYLFGDK